MTINAPATSLFALYVAYADECGVARKELVELFKMIYSRNILLEDCTFPPKESMRLTTDLMEWSKLNTPQWNTISVSGYHMREAGCTAAQEIAFTLANGLEYLSQAILTGLSVDDVAPRMSFFLVAITISLKKLRSSSCQTIVA